MSWYDPTSWFGGDEFQAESPEAKAQREAEEASRKEAHHALVAGNVNNSGGRLGSYGFYGNTPWETSEQRWDQSNAERVAQQQGNYLYGGSADGAANAIQGVNTRLDPVAANLGHNSGDFLNAAWDAEGDYRTGLGGLYGTAGALNQYAAQGPGPSVAQAQLEANTAAAQRAALSLAGSGRGAGGGAAAFRQALAQNAQTRGAMNGQSAMLQAQEAQDWRQAQLGAMGQAGQLYGQGAGLGGQQSQGYGALGMQGLQAQGQLGLNQEQLANQINMGALSGTMGYENNLTSVLGINRGTAANNAAMAQQERAANMALLGTGLTVTGAAAGSFFGPAGTAAGGAGGGATAKAIEQSDIRSKQNIRPADEDVMDTLRRLGGEGPSQAEQFSQRYDVGIVDPYAERAAPRIDYAFGPNAPGEGVDTSKAPSRPVAAALRAFGRQAPNDEEVAAAREDLRAKFGNQTAAEFDNYANALLNERGGADFRGASSSAYEYRDPARHGQGTHYGPMAQELEQTPAGRSAVVEQPDGTKGIDTSRLSLLNTSALGGVQRTQDVQNAKLADLESELSQLRRLAGEGTPSDHNPYSDMEVRREPRRKKKAPKVTYAFGPNSAQYDQEHQFDEPVDFAFGPNSSEYDKLHEFDGDRRDPPPRSLDDDLAAEDEAELRRQRMRASR